MTVKKHLRAQEVALQNRLPCVYLVDSGGAFLPMQDEVFPDREHFGRIFFNQATMSARGHPADRRASWARAPPAAPTCPAMSDETVIVRDQGTIFLGGPPLVKAATGEEVTAEELGGGDVHARTSGVVDHLADDDEHALEIVRSHRRDAAARRPRRRGSAARRGRRRTTRTACSTSSRSTSRTPYDVRELLRPHRRRRRAARVQGALRDDARLRVRPHRRPPGRDRRQQRHPVQRERAEGRALHRAVRPARHPAAVPAEHLRASWSAATTRPAGSPRTARSSSPRSSSARVPKLTVIVGGSFGAGNYGMCGRAYSPRFLWMWPNARICVMGGEQAATVMTEVGQPRGRRAAARASTSTRATRTTRPPGCGTTASSTRATRATSSRRRSPRARTRRSGRSRCGVFRM